jgi:hypothetical protein
MVVHLRVVAVLVVVVVPGLTPTTMAGYRALAVPLTKAAALAVMAVMRVPQQPVLLAVRVAHLAAAEVALEPSTTPETWQPQQSVWALLGELY